MVDERQEIFLAKTLFSALFDVGIASLDARNGNPNTKEPDVLIKFDDLVYGIELGALAQTNTMSYDRQKEIFLQELENYIKDRIPANLTIQLNFQYDKGAVIHKPSERAKHLTFLPKFLDGLFVYKNQPFANGRRIGLQESSKIPKWLFPNPRKAKEFAGFAEEIIHFVNGLSDDDFQVDEPPNHSIHIASHFFIITERDHSSHERIPYNPISEIFSESIIEKFKNKYAGNYDKIFLVLHNYGLGRTDTHFYWHYRDEVIKAFGWFCQQYQLQKEYDGVYFMDFSQYKDRFVIHNMIKGETRMEKAG